MNARYRFWMNVAAGALVVFLLSLGAAVWQVLYCVWPSALVSLGAVGAFSVRRGSGDGLCSYSLG